MDTQPLSLIRKVWRHSGITGNVWVPSISDIGVKDRERFREGAAIDSRKPHLPELSDDRDWYWTPAVSSSASRKAKEYPAQRALWVDCDESYDDVLLTSLKPSFMWETSPGHKQAVWLMREEIPAEEFHRDGLMGMLTQALGGDKSGVDIGQLLRVPGTWHHKREPFRGQVLREQGTVYTRGMVLRRVALGLGFSPQLASELGADDPYGDRSKLLWKFSRSAAELGLAEDLTFKLIKATKWNKWRDNPERLKEDISRAYAQQPATADKAEKPAASEVEEDEEEFEPWTVNLPGAFRGVLREPVRWVLPGIIPEGGCGLLVAAPKVGKTRVAIEIALGLATGLRPMGISVKRQTSTLFLSLEDGMHLFGTRLNRGINESRSRHRYHWDGHITPDLKWYPPEPMSLYTRFEPVDLSDEYDLQQLHSTIVENGIRLVIIDTLSMAIGKSDISNSKDMYSILKAVKLIAQETGCAIMFIHHTRKRVFETGESIQEMILGSTALHGWSDFIMNLVSPKEDSDLLRLGVQTKMGNHLHYVNTQLQIIKHAEPEDS